MWGALEVEATSSFREYGNPLFGREFLYVVFTQSVGKNKWDIFVQMFIRAKQGQGNFKLSSVYGLDSVKQCSSSRIQPMFDEGAELVECMREVMKVCLSRGIETIWCGILYMFCRRTMIQKWLMAVLNPSPVVRGTIPLAALRPRWWVCSCSENRCKQYFYAFRLIS